ncbi:LacI family transcriptional regulator [Verrucomicrobia bacterium IMCC26134]|jgi:DNA-binding LacI/PurR family transcriptional regulator|nr:LacI family transcriptional regulator [Verrucomicrobia bacterium IMCC26134]
MFSPRITLKQVAQQADVHISTAWRALKNDTYVEPAKRARIRAIAKELGYTPDPMLTALSNYRRKHQPQVFQSTLAWINNFPVRREGRELGNILGYHEGAQRFATQMGFKLEEFWLAEPGMTPRRAREVLLARGIRGLVFPPQPLSGTELTFDVEPFAAVTIGYSLTTPRLHVVGNHQHNATLQALRELAQLGHRRIGMVSATETMRRANHSFESPYHFFQAVQSESHRVPLFAVPGRDEPKNIAAARDAFIAWYKLHKPTAIISHVSEIRIWLEALGHKVPGDVSLATLSRVFDPDWSGIDQQEEQIGMRAVELLVSLFQNGERGAPGTPLRMLIEGRWCEGDTTRRLGPPATDLLAKIS